MESEDYLIEEGASEEPKILDDGMVEVDAETEAELRKAGIDFGVSETPPVIESEKVVESEIEQAPEEEHPAIEPEEEKPQEQPLILGKYKTQEDLERAYKEAERRLHEIGQATQRYQQAFEKMAEDPEGQKLISRVAFGQKPAEPAPQVPQTPEDFDRWAADMVARDRAKENQLAQLQGSLNQLYAYLEGQAVTQKYGDTLNELQPYINQVTEQLGQQASYRTREEIILLAEGLRSRDTRAVTATQQQTEQQKLETKQKHREKVMAASVEPANRSTEVAPKIVDPWKLPLEEHEKYLMQLGAKVVNR